MRPHEFGPRAVGWEAGDNINECRAGRLAAQSEIFEGRRQFGRAAPRSVLLPVQPWAGFWAANPPVSGWCLQTYYAELSVRFTKGYDPAISPVADDEMTPPAGLLLVASLHGEPVGCGALIFYPDAVGLVKRMWVAPAVRGLGPGRRLLTELEDRARTHGVRLMRLETKDELGEAIRMYRTAGYREVAPFNDEPYAGNAKAAPAPR